MTKTSIGARTPRVVVIGLLGRQFSEVRALTAAYPIELYLLEPKDLLRRHSICADLIVLTRFVGHKHSAHAEKLAGGRVRRLTKGATRAVADCILEFFCPNCHAA